jgi:hypothetical protein
MQFAVWLSVSELSFAASKTASDESTHKHKMSKFSRQGKSCNLNINVHSALFSIASYSYIFSFLHDRRDGSTAV